MKRKVTRALLENSPLSKTPNTSFGNNAQRQITPPHTTFLLICCMVLSSFFAWGQGTTSYLTGYKNNHYVPVPVNSNNLDFILAGTTSDFTGRICAYRTDNTGGVTASRIIYDINAKGLTVVDLTFMNTNGYGDVYYITCLRRADPLTVGDRDKIEVIAIDENLNHLFSYVIEDATITNGALTPVHTLAFNNELYICGYASEQFFTPLIDNYNTQKQGFVLRSDPTTSGTVAFSWKINTDALFTTAGVTTSAGVDYDMAVRMILIDPNNPNSDIYVTGSSNYLRFLNSSNTQAVFTSGIMNLSFLFDLSANSIPNQPFAKQYGSESEGEFGQDMKIAAGELFVLGNDYYALGSTGAVNFSDAHKFHFTAIDPSSLNFLGGLTSSTTARWADYGFENAWGLQTLTSHYPLASPNPDGVVIAGMARYVNNTCPISLPVSRNNYNPFTADFTLGYTGTTINISRNFVNLYNSYVGTGNSSLTNSYNQTNGWTFNNAWAPNIATQRAFGTYFPHLSVTAPFWNNAANELNTKFILADELGDANSGGFCGGTSINCIPNGGNLVPVEQTLTSIPIGATTYSLNNQPAYLFNTAWYDNSTHVIFVDEGPINKFCDQTVMKQNIVNNTLQNVVISFAPNPAQEKINITMDGNPETISIWLTDMTGRKVATLFDGKTENMLKQLPLPFLASGLYFVNFIVDNKSLPVQKLIIQ